MMQSLSYLIENNHSVRIDRKLLSEYELQNTIEHNRKPNSKHTAVKRIISSPKKYPTTKRPNSKLRNTKYQMLLTRTSSYKSKSKPPRSISPKTVIDIETLSRRVSEVEGLQSAHFTNFAEMLDQVRGELKKRNEIQEQQIKEFSQMRQEISATRKDLAEVIRLVNRKKIEDRDFINLKHRLPKSRAKSWRTSRSILDHFTRDSDYFQV